MNKNCLYVLYTPFHLEVPEFDDSKRHLDMTLGGPRPLVFWTSKEVIPEHKLREIYDQYQGAQLPEGLHVQSEVILGKPLLPAFENMAQFEKFLEFVLRGASLEKAHLFSVADFLTLQDQLHTLPDLPVILESHGTLLQNLDLKGEKTNFFQRFFGND